MKCKVIQPVMYKSSKFERDIKATHFYYTDSDMQGTEGALGGPDVRRRIPIKLLPKQARSKGFLIQLFSSNTCVYLLSNAVHFVQSV